MPKNVVIVGMPRSGTSMTAGIFVRQGYFVARDSEAELRDGDSFNPDGYFEADGLIEANVGVFNRAGFNHHNTWKFDAINQEQCDAIDSVEVSNDDRLLVQEFEQHLPWVWKDPRLCYTLGYWWPLLDHANTCVLLLHRDADDILKSFQRIGWRGSLDPDKRDIDARVLQHINAARTAIEAHDIPHFELQYRDFRDNPDKVVADINTITGLSLTVQDLGFRKEFDHSSGRGALELALEKINSRLPKSVTKIAKRVIPGRILRFFFPTNLGS